MLFQFGNKKDKVLEGLIRELEMNTSNNYKDAAQKSLKELEKAYEEAVSANRLKEGAKKQYGEILTSYRRQLAKFTHADKKASWD